MTNQDLDPETYWRAPEGESSWDNPDRPEAWKTASRWEKFLCWLEIHVEVDDGYGWDGGMHCSRCGKNWSH